MNAITKNTKYQHEFLAEKFVFNKAALASLRSNINGKMVSRVRIVCAVIGRAFMRLPRWRKTYFRIFQPVNMRGRTMPPQPKHACGNLSVPSGTPRVAAGPAVGIEELVGLMVDAVEKSVADHAGMLCAEKDGREIIVNSMKYWKTAFQDSETGVMVFSDWSKFGFYDADFGWGRPVSVGFGLQRVARYCVVLMRNREGDGIEAWVHLDEEDMRCFEQDEEIRLFTTK